MGRKQTIIQRDRGLAVGYLRVSTEDQNLGPEVQEAAIRRWADQHGVRLVSVHLDKGVSGATPMDKRDGFMAALGDLQASGAGHLVVAKLDRLARDRFVSVMIDNHLSKMGVSVTPADGVGVGDGPEAVMLRGILQVFAEYERAMIRMRTAAAMKVKKAKGERAGRNAPYGFADDGTGRLVPVPAEQEALGLARELRSQGMPLRAIAAHLEARGHQSRGKGWDPKTIARMIAA